MSSSQVRFAIVADARSGLLCRVIGLFAQLDLPAPAMNVSLEGQTMAVEIALPNFGERLVPVVANKIAGMVGVREVTLERMDVGTGTRPVHA